MAALQGKILASHLTYTTQSRAKLGTNPWRFRICSWNDPNNVRLGSKTTNRSVVATLHCRLDHRSQARRSSNLVQQLHPKTNSKRPIEPTQNLNSFKNKNTPSKPMNGKFPKNSWKKPNNAKPQFIIHIINHSPPVTVSWASHTIPLPRERLDSPREETADDESFLVDEPILRPRRTGRPRTPKPTTQPRELGAAEEAAGAR